MKYTRKKWCSWSDFVIPMHESTKELHRRQQSSLLQREPGYAEMIEKISSARSARSRSGRANGSPCWQRKAATGRDVTNVRFEIFILAQ
jgi:hypothetical protein